MAVLVGGGPSSLLSPAARPICTLLRRFSRPAAELTCAPAADSAIEPRGGKTYGPRRRRRMMRTGMAAGVALLTAAALASAQTAPGRLQWKAGQLMTYRVEE